MEVIFVGIDWAQDHHDICVESNEGAILERKRVPDGLVGVSQFHALMADHCEESADVIIGIETDKGLLVGALRAAGYVIYAINPLSASHYRDRHGTSGAKSDSGDAKMLADIVRTDRSNHQPLSNETELSSALTVLTRSHQNLIWTRQRHTNVLRSTLR